MQDPLSRFAGAGSAEEQLEALRSLAQAKTLQQASKNALFAEGMERLRQASESPAAGQRLTALAALGRIWSSLKPLRPSIEEMLSNAQIAEPEPTFALEDSDDREYVAQASRWIRAEWVPRYSATAAVSEDSAEKARTAHIETLLGATGDLGESVRLLTSRLSVVPFSTERPADSMGRRVRRLLSSLHLAARSHSGLGAEGAGRELATMVSNASQRFGPPKPDGLRREVVGFAAEVVHDVIRTHFSEATDPSTYDVLDVLKRWFRPHEWEEIATGTPALRLIASDASEAITLLAKAGLTDNRMRACLGLALGSERSANAHLAQLAERLSGVRPDVRHWLAGTEPQMELQVVAESATRNLDRVIADVLVRHEQMDQLAKRGTPIENGAIRLLINSFEELAKLRALEPALTTGEVVDYSPTDHEMVGGPQLGVRLVVVIESQIRARQSDGSYRIVRKALVRPQDFE